MRAALIFALSSVGCGARAGLLPTDPPGDASPPSEVNVAFSAEDCEHEFLAAFDRARSCFPHFGGRCGAVSDDDVARCVWSDGAAAPSEFLASGDFTSGARVCATVRWQNEGGPASWIGAGKIEFADGSRFGVQTHQATGFWISCPRLGTSFSVDDTLDTIRTCCR